MNKNIVSNLYRTCTELVPNLYRGCTKRIFGKNRGLSYIFGVLLVFLCSINIQAGIKLQKQGTATQLVVNGKPMLLMAGELSNSAATSPQDIRKALKAMHYSGVNAVFVPAYWEFVEPSEGKYDFALVDSVISNARKREMKVIFLWFGAWKNSMSCYAPLWVKENTKRFPRALTENGKPLEIGSAFSDNLLQADKQAFCELMKHIKAVDEQENTVVMMQVENEIGMLESARDHSPLAEKAYKQQVPASLLKALKLSKQGTWAEVFGTDSYADEKFQAYYYAKYVEQLASAGKAIHNIPMYVNAAMNSRGRKPGEYPSAGPLAHLINIWKHAAPSIDIFAPDLYDTGYKGWVAKYKRADNPFFTPEVKCDMNSGVKAYYTFGETDAISFSPFALDQANAKVRAQVRSAYRTLHQLSPILLQHQGKGDNWGLLFDQEDKERIIEDGDLVMTCRHFFTLPWDPRATDGSKWPEGGGLIQKIAKNEYLVAGNGIVVVFQSKTEKQQAEEKKLGEDGFVDNGSTNPKDAIAVNKAKGKDASSGKPQFKGKRIGIGYADQVSFDKDGKMQFIRRDNGDQDHQGRHVRISCGDNEILHVKLYEY